MAICGELKWRHALDYCDGMQERMDLSRKNLRRHCLNELAGEKELTTFVVAVVVKQEGRW